MPDPSTPWPGNCEFPAAEGAFKTASALPPKTLITPALFSHRPPPDREKRETTSLLHLRPGINAGASNSAP